MLSKRRRLEPGSKAARLHGIGVAVAHPEAAEKLVRGEQIENRVPHAGRVVLQPSRWANLMMERVP